VPTPVGPFDLIAPLLTSLNITLGDFDPYTNYLFPSSSPSNTTHLTTLDLQFPNGDFQVDKNAFLLHLQEMTSLVKLKVVYGNLGNSIVWGLSRGLGGREGPFKEEDKRG